jgi:hypothetical protein
MPLMKALFIVSNPVPVKYALNQIGFRVGPTRLPLVEPDEKAASQIREVLKKYKIDLPLVPGLQFLALFTVELGVPLEVGETGLARRRIFPITGGKFEGPEFKGRVLTGGADWQMVQQDGLSLIDTRYGLESQEGALIYISTNGYRYGPPEELEEINRRETVDPTKYYFRVNIRFETSHIRYRFLNHTLAIGAGMRLNNSVIFDAYNVT